ncbi:MAG: type II secretion system major pseudopilin GspG [Planctomycetes bacterium]|nr:type II secretion system major pseudopilin GspG [Planctomycetota bacterium]
MKKPFYALYRSEGACLCVARRQGFTLLELLIVMLIIGLLAAFVAPRMIGKVGKSKQTIAKAQIESLCTAIDTYKLDTDKYPTQEEGLSSLTNNPANVENWHGPYLAKKNVPKDPWGNEYVYTYPGNNGEFDIISYGADGKEGGEGENADVVSWE